MELDRGAIADALTAVGELLAAADERAAIVVTGGATLNLLGIVQRTTTDVDVIAAARRAEDGTWVLEDARPFPPPLARAVRTVARDFDLDEDWLNAEVGMQWSQGLPPWTLDEIEWRNFGDGLDVGLVGRRTLIALKLFAVVDRGIGSVHFQDLQSLSPSDRELTESKTWVLTQDSGARWPALVEEAVTNVERDR